MKTLNLILLLFCLAWFTNCSRYINIPRKTSFFGNNTFSEKSDSNKKSLNLKTVQIKSIEITSKKIKPVYDNSNSFLAYLEKKEIKKSPHQIRHSNPATSNKSIVYKNILPKEQAPTDSIQSKKSNKKFSVLSAVAGGLGLIDVLLIIDFFTTSILASYPLLILAMGIITLALSIVALALTRKSKDEYNNRYMALLGLIGGSALLLFVLIVFLIILFLLVLLL
jgi:hypothetical protein